MRTPLENIMQRIADLKRDLERDFSDPRVSPDLLQSMPGHEPYSGQRPERYGYARGDVDYLHELRGAQFPYAAQNPADRYDPLGPGAPEQAADERTAVLINHGRRSVYHRKFWSSGRKVAAGTAAGALLITILVLIMLRPGASWPPSVAIVQNEISKACQNPDVMSEPSQVNFACAKGTRQILWVFSLMTSGNDPGFADAKTGRLGLEPITPTQGGEVAASLNLHHPYNPENPIDSLEVAARAINNIIGGATLTDANGNPVVQAGLESDPANCVRYTGSPAIILRRGFPGLCAKPVNSSAGQGALVADVYRKWVVGASVKVAQDGAVLFENAKNPGDPRVQVILKQLPHSRLSA